MAAHLLSSADEWFLRLNKTDPYTGEKFKIGDEIYVCRQCKACYKKDTWEILTDHKCVGLGCGANNWISSSEFKPSLFPTKIDMTKPTHSHTFTPTPSTSTSEPSHRQNYGSTHSYNWDDNDVAARVGKVFGIILPILALIIGQIIQYSIYGVDHNVWILSAIFGEIPVLFMVISTICCVLCVALVCYNSWVLADNDSIAGCWWFNILSSVLFVLIPCFTGWIGIVLFPVLTIIFANHVLEDYEEGTSKVFSIVVPIVFYIIGQISEYYLYVTSGRVLILDLLFDEVPLWLLIVTSIASAIATGLVCYASWEKADDDEYLDSSFLFEFAGLLCGTFPCVFGVVGLIDLIILLRQIDNYSEEYVPVTFVISSFVIGQIILYWIYVRTGNVLILSGLLNLSGKADFNIVLFLIIKTVEGFASMIMAAYLGYYFVDDDEKGAAYLFLIPYCALMLLCPTMISLLALIATIVLLIVKDYDHVKVIISVFIGIMLLSAVVMVPVSGVSLGLTSVVIENGVTYKKESDGKYYVTEYSGDDDMLLIPRILKNKYTVGGVSDGFLESYSCNVFELNYEFATDNTDAIEIVAFTLSTSEKFPVPEREGYTFYGWWSTNNRNTGKQITTDDGRIKSNSGVSTKQEVYAMWFGSDYIFISSYSDFNLNNYSKYVLVNDIEMPSNYTPVGGLSGMETQSYRSAFNGILDGNYYTIKYSITGSRRYCGLFSWIGSKGVVKNLGVDVDINVSFVPTDVQYYAFAGGIAAINDGTISNCWCKGNIYLKSETSVAFTGGIAGASGTNNAKTGEITNCYNLARLETVADDAYAGGILGSAENNAHIVSYCYNRGTVKATGSNSNNTVAGGIISHGRTYAKNCFNAGAIQTDYSNKQTLGGIIGYVRNTSSHNNFPSDCVWLKSSSCQATYGIGQYSNDTTGGNNSGVTIITKEDNGAINLLNGSTSYFTLIDGKICLSWEK